MKNEEKLSTKENLINKYCIIIEEENVVSYNEMKRRPSSWNKITKIKPEAQPRIYT